MHAHAHTYTHTELCQTDKLSRTGAWWRAVTSRESVVKTGVPAEEVIKGSERMLRMMRERNSN